VKAALLAATLLLLAAATIPFAGVASALFTDVLSNANNAFSTDTLDPPTNLAASVSGSAIQLSWTVTVDTYAAGYKVLRSMTSGGPYTEIDSVTPRTATSYTDNTVTAGIRYYYVLRSYYQNWQSANSNEASGCAGICFDAASSSTPATGISFTWSHTVGTGGNRILIVGVSIRNSSSQTVSGVTYAGAPLTNIGVRDNGTVVRIEMWGLVNPPSGTANVVVTLSSAADAKTVCGATSWTGVHQTTPLGTFVSATGSTNAPTVNATSATTEVVHDTVAAQGTVTATVGAGQTQRWNAGTSGGSAASNVRGAGSTEPGAATVTMSYSLSASASWAIGAVSLKPAP
jgi:hypothetical protein